MSQHAAEVSQKKLWVRYVDFDYGDVCNTNKSKRKHNIHKTEQKLDVILNLRNKMTYMF